MAPDRQVPNGALEFKAKRNAKVKCQCTVRGCKTDKRAFNMVAKRTRQYHQSEQQTKEQLDKLLGESRGLAPTQPLASASQSASVPASSSLGKDAPASSSRLDTTASTERR